jgi:hypothetical protein
VAGGGGGGGGDWRSLFSTFLGKYLKRYKQRRHYLQFSLLFFYGSIYQYVIPTFLPPTQTATMLYGKQEQNESSIYFGIDWGGWKTSNHHAEFYLENH